MVLQAEQLGTGHAVQQGMSCISADARVLILYGDVPLVGFFAAGEVAHHRVYGYTGVLTVFTMPA